MTFHETVFFTSSLFWELPRTPKTENLLSRWHTTGNHQVAASPVPGSREFFCWSSETPAVKFTGYMKHCSHPKMPSTHWNHFWNEKCWSNCSASDRNQSTYPRFCIHLSFHLAPQAQKGIVLKLIQPYKARLLPTFRNLLLSKQGANHVSISLSHHLHLKSKGSVPDVPNSKDTILFCKIMINW